MATNSEMSHALRGTKEQVMALKEELMQKIADGFTLNSTEVAVLLAAESILNDN